jgi:hypothetical protein
MGATRQLVWADLWTRQELLGRILAGMPWKDRTAMSYGIRHQLDRNAVRNRLGGP